MCLPVGIDMVPHRRMYSGAEGWYNPYAHRFQRNRSVFYTYRLKCHSSGENWDAF